MSGVVDAQARRCDPVYVVKALLFPPSHSEFHTRAGLGEADLKKAKAAS